MLRIARIQAPPVTTGIGIVRVCWGIVLVSLGPARKINRIADAGTALVARFSVLRHSLLNQTASFLLRSQGSSVRIRRHKGSIQLETRIRLLLHFEHKAAGIEFADRKRRIGSSARPQINAIEGTSHSFRFSDECVLSYLRCGKGRAEDMTLLGGLVESLWRRMMHVLCCLR